MRIKDNIEILLRADRYLILVVVEVVELKAGWDGLKHILAVLLEPLQVHVPPVQVDLFFKGDL